MGYKIELVDGLPEMSFDQDTTIATDLTLSAIIPQGSFFLDPTLGLREMPKKITKEDLGLVNDYFRDSAKWLLDSGRARSVEVLVEPDKQSRDRVNVKETAIQANDTAVEFETFVGLV